MIIVSSPSKPFEYTLKGTPRRPIVIKAYEQEINDLYNSIVDSSQTDLPTPLKWTENETLDFIRLVVINVVKSKPDDNADIFQEGCDRFVHKFSSAHPKLTLGGISVVFKRHISEIRSSMPSGGRQPSQSPVSQTISCTSIPQLRL